MSIEQDISVADQQRKNKLIDESIHSYQQILKTSPQNKEVRLGLALAYEQKFTQEKETAFLTLAIANVREVLKLYPLDEESHNLLISLSLKQNSLGDLVNEYKSKLVKEPNNVLFKNCLKKINILSTLQVTPVADGVDYKPNILIKIVFDFVILISSVLFFYISLIVKPERRETLRTVSLGLMLIYLCYKWITYHFLTPQGLKKLRSW